LWEVWNEPNVRTFWRKDGTHNSKEFAEEYTALVRETVPAMLGADPDCFVMAGSVSNYWEPSYEWTEYCFESGILESGIRGWSVHPYGVKTPEEFAVGHRRMRELLAKHGAPDMPLLNTERGFAVKETPDGWSGGSKERAREFQAWHFVRQYMVDQLHDVRPTIWYEWDGDAFGLVDDGGSRPAYAACREMFEQLDGFRLAQRIDSDEDLDYVLLFENTAGDKRLVTWTAPPPGGTPDEAWPHHAEIHTSESSAKGDSVPTSIRVTLTGKPEYVVVAPNVEVKHCVAGEPIKGAAPIARTPEAPEWAVPLNLFVSGAKWEFQPNTGDGSFTLDATDEGKSIGVMAYDFTKSTARSIPYVLATTPVDIPEGTLEVWIHARSPIAQQLTFRLIDSTGQTHQFKRRIKGTGTWEAIRIPLTRRLEHWGGANDGQIHFPVKTLVFSVPRPSEEHKVGAVQYANVAFDPGVPPPEPISPKVLPDGKLDLRVCEEGAHWEFMKNTGQGSFNLGLSEDGKPTGTLAYDFTKSKSRSTPYVLAKTPVRLEGGAVSLWIHARSTVAQPLTFRLVDSTGQTHQFKGRIKGTGQWEEILIPLNKLEHWGGAGDGRIHYPVAWLVFSVPVPSEEHKTGTVEYADVIVQRDE
jgi:hypothetical protein